MSLKSCQFYNSFYGHKIEDLKIVKEKLDSQKSNKNYIYLVGDSSLDTKHWTGIWNPSLNGYEKIFENMKTDVSFYINKKLQDKNIPYICLNAAVECATISSKNLQLNDQDLFVSQNITSNDILVVSIGGNDIALAPSFNTILNMGMLQYLNSVENLTSDQAIGMNYFINLFKNQVEEYIKKIIGKTRPKKIVICCIYYPDTTNCESWASTALNLLNYNNNPIKLQTTIQSIFKYATSKISINDIEIIPFPMFEYLDANDSRDYEKRVEPSSIGASKLAFGIIESLFPSIISPSNKNTYICSFKSNINKQVYGEIVACIKTNGIDINLIYKGRYKNNMSNNFYLTNTKTQPQVYKGKNKLNQSFEIYVENLTENITATFISNNPSDTGIIIGKRNSNI